MNSGSDRSLPTMLVDSDCPFAARLAAVRLFADRVREMDAGQLVLPPHPAVTTAIPPEWTLDPFSDPNWRFQLHALRWAQNLKRAYDKDRDPARLEAYLTILRDWFKHNPWSSPPSDQSWADHSTAQRARVYAACAQAMQSPWPDWLRLALETHVDVLAGPDLYPSGGNHALNQNVGLFAAATVLGRNDEAAFAIQRTAELLARSVDDEGVTDEQSSEYQIYNYRRYHEAIELFRAAGAVLPDVFDRVGLMPEFVAHATLPAGHDVMIGDAVDVTVRPIPDTIAEHAATQGSKGPRPTDRVRVFQAGYIFARTGWGDDRAFTSETHLSVRFGPARIPHGHHDAMAISLASHGHRVITNAGKYAYVWDEMRRYVLSRQAQNSIYLPDCVYGPDGGSQLIDLTVAENLLVGTVRDDHYPQVALARTVVFDLDDGATAVIDRFASRDGETLTAEQRFRLAPSWDPGVASLGGIDGIVATHPDNLTFSLQHFVPVDEVTVVRGQSDPFDGWVSLRYGQQQPAPVIVSRRRAASGMFTTLLSTRDRNQHNQTFAQTFAVVPVFDRDQSSVSIRGQSINLPPLDGIDPPQS